MTFCIGGQAHVSTFRKAWNGQLLLYEYQDVCWDLKNNKTVLVVAILALIIEVMVVIVVVVVVVIALK